MLALDSGTKLRLAAQMEGVRAEEILQSGRDLDAKSLRACILAATGSEKAANDAYSKAEEDRLARIVR